MRGGFQHGVLGTYILFKQGKVILGVLVKVISFGGTSFSLLRVPKKTDVKYYYIVKVE